MDIDEALKTVKEQGYKINYPGYIRNVMLHPCVTVRELDRLQTKIVKLQKIYNDGKATLSPEMYDILFK